MFNGYYESCDIKEMGAKRCGKNVLISTKASIYGLVNMEFGDNVRIDDFCHLSGKILIGNNVHIAPFCNLVGGHEGIMMEDFSGLSARVSVYAITDDYSGETMTNPTVPDEYKKICEKKVILKRHSIIGAGSVVLPGAVLEEGTACGSLTLINKRTEPWGVYVGIPAKRLTERKKDLLQLERQYLDSLQTNG